MTLQAEQTIGHGIIALAFQQGDRKELAFGFGHLTGIGVQMMDMEPVVAPFMTKIAFRLSDLIGMVRESIINTTGMNIQILAQMLHGDAGAFNVPAGITDTPGRIPLQSLILKFRLCKPQNKVVLIALVGIFFNTFTNTDLQIIFVMVVEHIVFLQLGGIKVNIAAGDISKAFVKQAGNDLNEFINAAGGRFYHLRALDIQLFAVGEKCVRVKLCDLHDGLILTLSALQHLILAGIGIGSQVAHIGDVHNTDHIITLITQSLFQHIFHDIGAQIADMRKMIHRRAAGIHLDNIRIVRLKQFLLVGKGVVKIHK